MKKSKVVKKPIDVPAESVKLNIGVDIVDPQQYPWTLNLKQLDDYKKTGGTDQNTIKELQAKMLTFTPIVEKGSIKSNSVDDVVCSDVFEYIPGKMRGVFMDELYRVMKVGAKALFSSRYWNTAGAIQDYLYEAPPVSEQSFLYFNKGWRLANKLKRPLVCDFDYTYGYIIEPDTANRSEEVRSYNLKHYSNVVQVLQILLTKRDPEAK